MPALASLLCGFIFGAGLVISHMAQTTKVLGFLDVPGIPSGTWDPSLIVVMAAGLIVTGIGFALIRPRTPIFAQRSLWPSATDIDRPLLAGAALFGIGWGLVGLCPGPALVDLATLSPRVIVFVFAMAAGMVLHEYSKIGRLGRAELAAAAATDG